ncbi:MAG TPA: hypothetical protein VMF69_19690 [Gemmataceae bacterium]|nr:hypothetical protein [Gemmataceae bacterium]
MTYLPRDPNVHSLGSAQPLLQSHYQAANVIAWTLSLVFAFLLLFVEIRARRELRLACIGEVTEGRIIEKTMSTGKNRTTYWVRYRLDTPDQQRRTGWVWIGPLLWESLHYGALIAVLYDPEHPGRHRPSFGFRYVHFLAETGEARQNTF